MHSSHIYGLYERQNTNNNSISPSSPPQALCRAPHVFNVLIGWHTAQASASDIEAVFDSIPQTLTPTSLFRKVLVSGARRVSCVTIMN